MPTEEILDGIQEALTAALGDLDTKSALNEICRITMNMTKGDEGGIYLVSEDGKMRTLVARHGYGTPAGRSVPVDVGVIGYVITNDVEVHTPDIVSDPRSSGVRYGGHAAIIVPIKARGKVLGSLTTIRRKTTDDLTEEDAVAVRLLALIAAAAVTLRS